MNCLVGVCHFCEYHGPRVVHCTGAGAEALHSPLAPLPPPALDAHCGCGCTAAADYGPDEECSPEGRSNAVSADLLALAAIRSLSCEVSSDADDASVFFGDDIRGYVCSYAFRVPDTRARGLKRWFSFVALSSDKIYLMNVTPFFLEKFKKVADGLIDLAKAVYDEEQARHSQRALRLGDGVGVVAPRSLLELTRKENLFVYLRAEFRQILSCASKLYSESYRDSDSERRESHRERNLSIVDLKRMTGRELFRRLIYCASVGKRIFVRGDLETRSNIVDALSRVSPPGGSVLPDDDERATTAPAEASPEIQTVEGVALRTWTGELPPTLPTYVAKILKCAEADDIPESVVERHVASLREEWTNNCRALRDASRSTSSKENLSSLKKIFGITARDEPLVEYWTKVIR